MASAAARGDGEGGPRHRADPVPAASAGQAAFFDFDKTLLHGDAGVIFGWTLLDYGFAQGAHLAAGSRERRAFDRAVRAQAARIIGKGALYRSLHAVGIIKRSKLVELTYRFLEGMPASDMSLQMRKVWNDELRARLFPEMLRVLQRHRAAGRRIVIVTTGLRELVEQGKDVLGEDVAIIGAEMRTEDGRWLGRVEGPLYGVQKASAVRAWAEKSGIDLSESWAYSDHFSDVAFLACVGHPVAVNPSIRLRLHARKRGWEILNVVPPAYEDSPADP